MERAPTRTSVYSLNNNNGDNIGLKATYLAGCNNKPTDFFEILLITDDCRNDITS